VRRFIMGSVVSAIFIGTLAVSPLTAHGAAPHASTINATAGMYHCVKKGVDLCTVKFKELKANASVTMICWEDGRHSPSFVWDRWFLVTASGGVEGFVKAERVSTQWENAPECSNVKRASAVSWAIGRLGQPTVSQTDINAYKKRFPGWPLPFGAGNRWSGDCIAFVTLAYFSTGVNVPGGDAIEVARKYSLKGGEPQYGSLIFWNVGDKGHVGIYIGGNRVIATRGVDADSYAIKDYAKSFWSGYMGWVRPY